MCHSKLIYLTTLESTGNFWLLLRQICLRCSSKIKLLSIVIPRAFQNDYLLSIAHLLILNVVLAKGLRKKWHLSTCSLETFCISYWKRNTSFSPIFYCIIISHAITVSAKLENLVSTEYPQNRWNLNQPSFFGLWGRDYFFYVQVLLPLFHIIRKIHSFKHLFKLQNKKPLKVYLNSSILLVWISPVSVDFSWMSMAISFKIISLVIIDK